MQRVAVGSAVAIDARDRLLLVPRAFEPEAGLWSVPGGRLEHGETLALDTVREVLEETGIVVRVDRELATFDLAVASDVVYEVHDFAATPVGGSLRPGDDAADARWVERGEAAQMPLTANLLQILNSYGVFTA